MPELEFVRVDIAERIATVTFDRPPVNALNHQAWRELTTAFTALAANTEAHITEDQGEGKRRLYKSVERARANREGGGSEGAN